MSKDVVMISEGPSVKPINLFSNKNKVSAEAIQRLDEVLITLETIDLNGIQSFYSLSNKLRLNDYLPNKVTIWKLRNNNPMRKSFINNKIKLEEFNALTKITVEMSKYLYPYIRDILQSREDFEKNPLIWNDYKKRFMDLINERFNINSMKVKKILDPSLNDEILIKCLLTLALSVTDIGYQNLKNSLLDS